MEISYEVMVKEIEDFLKEQKIWVLATSKDDYVTTRPMSIMNKGLILYFQTHESYTKYEQIKSNPKVSLCCQNVSIEGEAEYIGNWDTPENEELCSLYRQDHESSYQAYGRLEGEVVIKVTPHIIKVWKYIDGEPTKENLYVKEMRAERLGFV